MICQLKSIDTLTSNDLISNVNFSAKKILAIGQENLARMDFPSDSAL